MKPLKNEQIMRTILLIILLCLINCGGGFEVESPEAQDISDSILGRDSSSEMHE